MAIPRNTADVSPTGGRLALPPSSTVPIANASREPNTPADADAADPPAVRVRADLGRQRASKISPA